MKRYVYEYGESGRITSRYYRVDESQPYEVNVESSDAEGTHIQVETLDEKGLPVLRKSITYEFDSARNWTTESTHTFFLNLSPDRRESKEVITRTIEYY